MQQERLWKLISRKLTGEASDNDLRMLNQAIKSDTQISSMMEMLLLFWESGIATNMKADTVELEKVWARVNPGADINNVRS